MLRRIHVLGCELISTHFTSERGDDEEAVSCMDILL